MSLLALPGVGYARVNWSRWLVDCPSPLCSSAMTLGPAWTDHAGRVWPGLVRGQGYMACRDCGHVAERVEWPPDPDGIEAILSMRPEDKTRNWEPGESLEQLLTENAVHGILPPAELIGDDGVLMLTAGDVITGGALVAMLPQFVGARELFAIGA